MITPDPGCVVFRGQPEGHVDGKTEFELAVEVACIVEVGHEAVHAGVIRGAGVGKITQSHHPGAGIGYFSARHDVMPRHRHLGAFDFRQRRRVVKLHAGIVGGRGTAGIGVAEPAGALFDQRKT